ISAALGVYTAFNAEALGENEPAPPLHVPLAAPPPTCPASCACGADAHTTRSAPALAVALGLIVTCIVALAAPQGPAGSSLVSVRVTPPAAISAALAVYTAFSA